MAQKFEYLRNKAHARGLGLAYHNPGDGRRYRILPDVKDDYFDGGFFTSGSLSEIAAFLDGWDACKAKSREAQSGRWGSDNPEDAPEKCAECGSEDIRRIDGWWQCHDCGHNH